MTVAVGTNIDQTYTTISDGKGVTPGTTFRSFQNKTYIFVKASGALAVGDVVTYDETFTTTVVALSTDNDAEGDPLGVAVVAIPSGSYGWIQIEGVTAFSVLASCAANVQLNTTATAGALDDDATNDAFPAIGLYLTVAATGAAVTSGVIQNKAYQGTVLFVEPPP